MRINDQLTSEPVAEAEPVSPRDLPEDERIELFRMSDDPADIFYVPKKVGPNVTLRYLRDVRQSGPEYAMAGLLERVLGADAMEALADDEDLTDEDMERIGSIIEKHVMGTSPLARKERRAGSRGSSNARGR